MPIKVLIADDEDGILQIMAKKISGAGYQVVTAADGQEAWDKIKSEDPDLVILDLTMPKMDGWQVLKALRENPPGKKWQPVIIISALGEIENMQKGLHMEADHYMTKPCSIDDIIKTIRLMVSLIPMRQN
jgi:DNA-binding response OmpR family regulator